MVLTSRFPVSFCRRPALIFRRLSFLAAPILAAAFSFTAPSATLWADVKPNALFSDKAVLQKSDNVPVWGKADPGEDVTVSLLPAGGDTALATATGKADADGKWRVKLDLSGASIGQGPYALSVRGGKNELSFKDVLVGEVWMCGGQSNMDFPLKAFPVAKEEVPKSANPLLRQFKVQFNASPVPVDDVKGKWVEAGPDTSGDFSATAYFFGKQVQKELGGPVGLLNDCVGGTMVEAWTSAEALDTDPDLKAGREKAQGDRAAFDNFSAKYEAWMKKYGREDRRPKDDVVKSFAGPDVDTADWKPVTLPGTFAAAGLPDAGAIWIRKKIPVPGQPDIVPNKGIDMFLADVRDSIDVYFNGTKVGSGPVTKTVHRYGARSNLVQPGEAVLALRVFNPGTGAGIQPAQGANKGRFQANHFGLSGEWLAKAEFELPPLDGAAKADLPSRPALPFDPQNVACWLYNGMIHPVLGYGVRGVIWYQGEGNWNRGYQYRTAFKLLIQDWRTRWGRGEMPFYFCQIAGNAARPTRPGNDWHSEVREAQNMALSLPNTGQAILIDIGEEGNIHPANKMDVGDRLARLALARTYGRKISASGPVYSAMAIEGDKVRITFTSPDGLSAKDIPPTYKPISTEPKELQQPRNAPDGELEGFAICGEDKKWVWANAKIENDGSAAGGAAPSVIVWSPTVPRPVAVRYAWSPYPLCNLYSKAGLPAGPFRTDDFPTLSVNNKYGAP